MKFLALYCFRLIDELFPSYTFKPFYPPLFSSTDHNVPGCLRSANGLTIITNSAYFRFFLQVMVLARTKCLFLLCSVLTVATIVIFHDWSDLLHKKPKVKGLRETSSPEVTGLLNTPKVTSVPRQLDTNKITLK